MHLDDHGWLVPAQGDPPVSRVPTPRTVPLSTPTPIGVVWHWTGTRGQTPRHAHLLAQSIASGFGPSWHLLISRFGEVVQSAPVTVGTNHVGRTGRIAGQLVSVNPTTVGIELENAGRLMRADGAWAQVMNPHEPRERHQPTGLVVPDNEVLLDDGGAWHAYSDQQIAAAEVVLRALVAGLHWHPAACLHSHAELDPGRKADPGRLWMERALPAIVDRIFKGVSRAGAV